VEPITRLRLYLALALSLVSSHAGCASRSAEVKPEQVNPELRAASGKSAIAISDALEALIAIGRDTEQDRRYAYQLVSRRQVRDAEAAFARAAVAGRLAQVSGLGAPSLVKEVEEYARSSMSLARDFRRGAAQRMLGTLYVLAPAIMLEHGDSETGLELLEQLGQRWPDDPETRLRLAEAYVALDDAAAAGPHLCFCLAHRAELRGDDQKLLARLQEDAGLRQCP